MATPALTDQQIIELFERLPPERKSQVLLILAKAAPPEQRWQVLEDGEERLRQLAAERGKNWDEMSDDQRLFFVDDLIHEDRVCEQ